MTINDCFFLKLDYTILRQDYVIRVIFFKNSCNS